MSAPKIKKVIIFMGVLIIKLPYAENNRIHIILSLFQGGLIRMGLNFLLCELKFLLLGFLYVILNQVHDLKHHLIRSS